MDFEGSEDREGVSVIRPEVAAFFHKHKSVPYFVDGEFIGALVENETVDQEFRSATAAGARDVIRRADFDNEGIEYLWVDDTFRAAVRCATTRIVLPDTTTAQNTEVSLMNICWWYKTVDGLGPKASQYALYENKIEFSDRTRMVLDSWLDLSDSIQGFVSAWHKSGFARLDIGHKLAAALMFTDPGDVFVRCPWKSVSIQIPSGLCEPFRRIWVMADEQDKPVLISVLAANGIATGTSPDRRIVQEMNDDRARLLNCFMNGALLAVTEPVALRSGTHGAAGRTKRHTGPPVAGELYVLGASIDIDLREEVKAVWNGEKHQGPKVQFLVRGHWREQVCGSQRMQRKRIWIKPFWKGPEAARVLLRTHTIE